MGGVGGWCGGVVWGGGVGVVLGGLLGVGGGCGCRWVLAQATP